MEREKLHDDVKQGKNKGWNRDLRARAYGREGGRRLAKLSCWMNMHVCLVPHPCQVFIGPLEEALPHGQSISTVHSKSTLIRDMQISPPLHTK
jgi:hypothetical protein